MTSSNNKSTAIRSHDHKYYGAYCGGNLSKVTQDLVVMTRNMVMAFNNMVMMFNDMMMVTNNMVVMAWCCRRRGREYGQYCCCRDAGYENFKCGFHRRNSEINIKIKATG
jgi:hypothetical protein